jgi:hypothetical protein
MTDQDQNQDPKELSLRTQLEMARGGLARAVDRAAAERYVRNLGILADGDRQLRRLVKGGLLAVRRHPVDMDFVFVSANATGKALAGVVFVESIEGFPSPTLKAQIMLLLG